MISFLLHFIKFFVYRKYKSNSYEIPKLPVYRLDSFYAISHNSL
jgi:hypothetical protein